MSKLIDLEDIERIVVNRNDDSTYCYKSKSDGEWHMVLNAGGVVVASLPQMKAYIERIETP